MDALTASWPGNKFLGFYVTVSDFMTLAKNKTHATLVVSEEPPRVEIMAKIGMSSMCVRSPDSWLPWSQLWTDLRAAPKVYAGLSEHLTLFSLPFCGQGRGHFKAHALHLRTQLFGINIYISIWKFDLISSFLFPGKGFESHTHFGEETERPVDELQVR